MDRCPGTRRMTDAAELTGEVRYESDLSLRKTKLATIVTIANMFATSLLVFGALTLVNVLLTTQFGWTQTEYSWGMTAVLWCGASFMPLYGRPIDKIGVRPLIIFGIIGVGFCALAMGFMTGALWQFMRFLVCSACSAARRWAIRRSSARCPSIRRTAEWSMGGRFRKRDVQRCQRNFRACRGAGICCAQGADRACHHARYSHAISPRA